LLPEVPQRQPALNGHAVVTEVMEVSPTGQTANGHPEAAAADPSPGSPDSLMPIE
jgi:hypothetical protein